MWSIRKQVSALIAEGHSSAPDYPLAFMWEEVHIITERKNMFLATEGTILQTAINTGIAAFGKDGGRKAHSVFQKLMKSLLVEVGPAQLDQPNDIHDPSFNGDERQSRRGRSPKS